MPVSVLHNFCEIQNESINEESVRMTLNFDRDFQPQTLHVFNPNNMASSNQTEGKRIRGMLTNYFDP